MPYAMRRLQKLEDGKGQRDGGQGEAEQSNPCHSSKRCKADMEKLEG